MTVVIAARGTARGTARVWLPPVSTDDATIVFPVGLTDAVAAYPTCRLVGHQAGAWLFWVGKRRMMVAELQDYETTGTFVTQWVRTTVDQWMASFETFGQTLITHLRH